MGQKAMLEEEPRVQDCDHHLEAPVGVRLVALEADQGVRKAPYYDVVKGHHLLRVSSLPELSAQE